MHTVLTGLQSDNIKSDLQPYLLQTNTSDELLLEKLNIACGNEKERQDKKKHTAPSRVTNVNTVQSSELPVEKKNTIPQRTATLPPDLLSEIKEMRSDMVLLKDLKAEVSQIRETIQRSRPAPPQYPQPSREPANMPAPYPVFLPPQPHIVTMNQIPCPFTNSSHQQQCRSTDQHSVLGSRGRQLSSSKGLHLSGSTQHHALAQGVSFVCKQAKSTVSIVLGVEAVNTSEQVVKHSDQ